MILKIRILTALLMLTVLMGPLMGRAEMPCQMQDIHMTMMDHSTPDKPDCCDMDGACTSAGCSFVMILPVFNQQWTMMPVRHEAPGLIHLTGQVPPGLFRPPIA